LYRYTISTNELEPTNAGGGGFFIQRWWAKASVRKEKSAKRGRFDLCLALMRADLEGVIEDRAS